MHDGSQGHAMTEIALALAIGFFSLLVPTMVSMGAGHGGAGPAVATLLKAVPAVAGNAPSAPHSMGFSVRTGPSSRAARPEARAGVGPLLNSGNPANY